MSCSEELRRFFLAGIGAMATTAEKSKEIVDAFVRKGELTVEQGRIINEELKRDVKKTVSQAEDTVKRHVEIAVDSDAPLVRKSLLEQLEQMSPEELELLRSKLAEMAVSYTHLCGRKPGLQCLRSAPRHGSFG